ncbi:MAG: hypothetical protein KQH63_21315 [Desulfobulbaceae bacterium]|nr:hypothetical protein [Desulfobulbaceae bacterium]
MKLYRPKSFRILLLAAFSFVALPLLMALASSAYFMEKMATKSTKAIFSSAGSARESRLLLEQLVAQERQARLYDVLGEPANLLGVQQKHESIQEILDRLSIFPFGEKEKKQIVQLKAKENALFKIISDTNKNNARKDALDEYKELNTLCREIETASYNLMVQEAQNLHQETSEYQKIMFWQTFLLFFLSIVLISIFAFLLIRPIRQIDAGIIRLGKGDFVTPISVSGPRDLEFLGTKLDWLRERLAELEKEKNKFIAHISHELKTPLASIREGAGLLSEEVVGSLTPQQKEVIKILTNNSRVLQKLIENIVNFNMAQARSLPPPKDMFSLEKLITEVTEDYKPILMANHLDLKTNLAPAVIKGNRDQIRTVIDNLLSNAIKHSPIASEISLIMKRAGNEVVIDIVDTGPGIPEDERTEIFRPFFQGKAAQKGRVKGTGLGLAIAREYMTNHKGHIDLIIDKKAGSHFKLTLPIEDKE